MKSSDSSSWIVEGKLLACPFPKSADRIADLARAGVRLCLNLHIEPLPAGHLSSHGITELHLPVPDFTAPSPVVLAAAVRAIDAALATGQAVAVNCLGGLGRTGTVVAAWLVSQGASADEAIAQVRGRRPGSIETADQVAAVRRFADSLESRAH